MWNKAVVNGKRGIARAIVDYCWRMYNVQGVDKSTTAMDMKQTGLLIGNFGYVFPAQGAGIAYV